MHHNAAVRRLPPGDLVPMERIGVHEFPNWQSLRSFVTAYAIRTKQIYVAHSVEDVVTHNASVRNGGKKVPVSVGVYSQVFGCIHGNGQLEIQQLDPESWENTQCPAQIEAHATFDFSGRCRLVVAEQYAYHNHAFSEELVERYARARQMNACVKVEPTRSQRQHERRNNVAIKRLRPSDQQPVDIIDLAGDEEAIDAGTCLEKQMQVIPASESSTCDENTSTNEYITASGSSSRDGIVPTVSESSTRNEAAAKTNSSGQCGSAVNEVGSRIRRQSAGMGNETAQIDGTRRSARIRQRKLRETQAFPF